VSSEEKFEEVTAYITATDPPYCTEMQIDLSAKNTHNLSVLKKIDSNVSGIISEASDTAIYRFDAAEKKWERFGFQGAVFVTQNIQPPYHSLIVLNKLGKSDSRCCRKLCELPTIVVNSYPLSSSYRQVQKTSSWILQWLESLRFKVSSS
jgi:Dcp1-like decapping family